MTPAAPILVTGAAGGIGTELVRRLAARGVPVLAQGRSAERLDAFADLSDAVTCVVDDLADASELPGLVKRLVAEHGPLGGLVHLAGHDKLAPLYLAKPADAAALFHIHGLVPMTLVGLLAKKGNAAPGCSIVLVSSLAAHEGAGGHTAYAAAKGAIEGFLRPAASELAPKGIRLNVVTPGVVLTAMSAGFVDRLGEEQRAALEASYPLGLGSPADVAEPIEFLLGEASRWITGQTLVVDGGHLARSV
ncbi:SDR family NAD(P)-dependent oxidoreductase [Propioniciclava tarda]|uniref:SDR family oxidoreductase n=1 Tax=Propioniciclava tarda TaxID=433330 RepID=A0A4Q9KPE4_PROTD|nr:SDR family oxidoreductase [Propioniciclava tarda]TBT96205.1 SDR family oxidoreductase [Propioniciclava tarda]SMO33428.1 NAD(P)-dependent dehydrogenase, short-chain alcohol dehydrogenase family [Propioniciclava tarda]